MMRTTLRVAKIEWPRSLVLEKVFKALQSLGLLLEDLNLAEPPLMTAELVDDRVVTICLKDERGFRQVYSDLYKAGVIEGTTRMIQVDLCGVPLGLFLKPLQEAIGG